MSDWIEWKWDRDVQYPETLDTRVDVKFRDWYKIGNDYTVEELRGPDTEHDHWHQTGHPGDIVAYRIAT